VDTLLSGLDHSGKDYPATVLQRAHVCLVTVTVRGVPRGSVLFLMYGHQTCTFSEHSYANDTSLHQHCSVRPHRRR